MGEHGAWVGSGSSATAATPRWCARNWRASWGWRCRCARWSGRVRRCAGSCGPRRWPRCASRPRRASSCRSTSAAGAWRSAASLRGVGLCRHPRLLAALLRAGVPPRAAECLVRGHGGGLPALRRGPAGGAARQRPGAGDLPRPADPGGAVQRALPRLCRLLGGSALRLRALPRPHQGQGRARGRLRQAQRHGRALLRQLGGAGRSSGLVDARGRRRAHPWQHRRAAHRALCPGGARLAPAQRAPPTRPVGP